MKKVILVGAALAVAWFIFKPKSTDDDATANVPQAGGALMDPNDGFGVINSKGNSLVLKDGYAYYISNERTWNEYLAKFPQFKINKVLTNAEIEKYPINGNLSEGITFNKIIK